MKQHSPTPVPYPKIIISVSHGQFSIARHSGAIKINGVEYFYLPAEDALICKSLVKQYNKHRKAGGPFLEFAKMIKG